MSFELVDFSQYVESPKKEEKKQSDNKIIHDLWIDKITRSSINGAWKSDMIKGIKALNKTENKNGKK